ncbi:C10 family peptidase [Niabella beijingensis]|uniref:C10 family peptidase n=1 Tax=Niabella beijingensis TaxID=2872700 RepID=UPI001CBC9546|nr:C10 family peptidase [Niabella beijingensis]MBZ4192647.1 C10 family peptidase [Niabella beijingensis]
MFYLSIITLSCSKQEKSKTEFSSKEIALNAAQVEKKAFGKISFIDGAYDIPLETVEAIAVNLNGIVPDELKLSNGKDRLPIEKIVTVPDSTGDPAMYIVNYAKNNLAIFSADERSNPLLAVVPSTKYEAKEVPPGFYKWLEISMDFIALAKNPTVGKDLEKPRAAWKKIIKDAAAHNDKFLRANTFVSSYDTCIWSCPNYPDCMTYPELGCGGPDVDPCAPSVYYSKGPYLTTTWGQGCTYNNLVPWSGCTGTDRACSSNDKAPTGCVPTAMAQILKYWNHPSLPNFDYVNMPDSYGNAQVQLLMASAGSSLPSIDYGCAETGARLDEVDDALKSTKFGFTHANYATYGTGSYTTVISNLNSGIPVILGGCRDKVIFVPTKCHAWVCDGYYESGDQCYRALKFHMNWGWDGLYNGWYDFNNWEPAPGYHYQYGLDMIYNAYP